MRYKSLIVCYQTTDILPPWFKIEAQLSKNMLTWNPPTRFISVQADGISHINCQREGQIAYLPTTFRRCLPVNRGGSPSSEAPYVEAPCSDQHPLLQGPFCTGGLHIDAEFLLHFNRGLHIVAYHHQGYVGEGGQLPQLGVEGLWPSLSWFGSLLQPRRGVLESNLVYPLFTKLQINWKHYLPTLCVGGKNWFPTLHAIFDIYNHFRGTVPHRERFHVEITKNIQSVKGNRVLEEILR